MASTTLTALDNTPIGSTTPSTGAFTSLTVGTTTTAGPLAILGPAGSQRRLQWNSVNSMRWLLYANATAETGSNVGSDLDLIAASDAGASTGVVARFTRSTGSITLDPARVYTTGIFTSNLPAIFAAINNTPIGQTTPSTGSFTTLTAGNLTASVTATGTTTARTLQDRARDWLNIKDFGAKIDGTTLDTAAVNATLRAANTNGTIWFPYGSGSTNFAWGGVTGGPQTPLLWKIDGTLSGGSRMNRAFSRNNIGDMFENFYAGSKFLSVMSAKPDQPPMLNLEYAYNVAGGTGGAIHTPLRVTAQDNAGAVTSLWGIHVDMASYSDIVGTWPQQVGVSASLLKYGHAWCAGMHITAADVQNLPTSTGGTLLGFELGQHANDDDDGGLSGSIGLRLGFKLGQSEQISAASGGVVPAVFGAGYLLSGTPNAVTRSCFVTSTVQTYQVFDARTAKPPPGYTDPVAALRMNAGQIVDFSGANTVLNSPGWKGPAGRYLQYQTSGTPRLRYMNGATELFSIADTGAVLLKADPTTALGAATKQYVDSKVGKIDAIPIGQTTPSTGNFTTLTSATLTTSGNTTVTGNATLLGASHIVGADTNANTFFTLKSQAGGNRRLQWNTRITMRWGLYANATAETGNNVGSDLDLIAANDTGGSTGVVARFTRSTGSITFDLSRVYPTGIFTCNLGAAFTKQMSLRSNYALNGSPGSANSIFWSDATISGQANSAAGGFYEINRLNVVDTATPISGYARRALLSLRYLSSTGAAGVTYALLCRAGDNGVGIDRSLGFPYQAMAGCFNTTNIRNQGGTATTDTSGAIWGISSTAFLNTGATFYDAVRGAEIDFGINTGASARYKTGLKITQQNDKVDAINGGQFILLGRDIGNTAFLDGINFGSAGDVGWSWAGTSKLINASGYGNDYTGQSLKAAYGFDAYAVDFTSAFLRSYGAFGPFLADGSGVQIGPMRFTPSGAGLTIDATGAYGTGVPTIAAAGTNYKIGDLLFFGTGGVARVTAVATGGGVTTITVSRQPYITTGIPPVNPLAATVDYRSVGNGCKLNVTWNTSANTLTLNPSGTVKLSSLNVPNITTNKITQILGVSDPVAPKGDHGYMIDQALSWNPGPNASGIYFGNKMGCVIYGSQTRAGAQIWNNLDQMVCVTDATSSADYVNRYIQSVRFQGAGQSQMWCAVLECRDMSGLRSSQSGTMLSLEVDLVADDEDDAMCRQGIAICMLTGANPTTKPPMTYRNAISVWSGYGLDATKNLGVIRMFELNCPFREAGLDFRWSLPMTGTTGNAMWLRAAHKVVFNKSGSAYLQATDEFVSEIKTSGNLIVNGNAYKPGGGSWLAMSDGRIKTQNGVYASGLAEVLQLNPIRFHYDKRSGYDADLCKREYIGLVAQEVESVMPELVSCVSGRLDDGTVDDLRVTDTTPLVFALVNAVKELTAKIEAMTADR